MSSFRRKSVITTQILLTLGILVTLATQFQNCAGAKFDQNTDEQGQGTPNPPPETPVEEIFKTLKPALAVRGIGCFTCHANINASIITDAGFGNAFYRKASSTYSRIGFDQMTSFPSQHTLYIPKTGDDLESYLKRTKPYTVEQRDRVFIGAPSAARLRQVAGGSALKYQKASATSPDLSGVSGASGAYVATGTVQCDGDLFIEGSLHLKSATVVSDIGCRMYVTKAVFITGGLKVQNVGAGSDHNLQITSALGITLGMDRDAIAERYYQTNLFFAGTSNDVLPMRGVTNVTAYGDSVIAEAERFTDLTKADNETGGRVKPMSRLLLNAPRIDSHYRGNFSGVIITEVAMMSVGSFSYTYDPVFTRVPILPKVSNADYLDVK